MLCLPKAAARGIAALSLGLLLAATAHADANPRAEQVRLLAKTQYEADVGFDISGVEWLESRLFSQLLHREAPLSENAIADLGVFFGECLVNTYHAQWLEDGRQVRLPNKQVIDPVASVRRNLQNGSDSVLALFLSVPHLR